MASLNRVLLMGNLTRCSELRFTPAGQPIANFGIAMNRKFKDSKTNELREEVTFVDVEWWGEGAANAHSAGQLDKGKVIFLEGRLKFEQWDDKQTGQKRSKLKVVADRVQFTTPAAPQQAQPAQEATVDAGAGIDESGVPF